MKLKLILSLFLTVGIAASAFSQEYIGCADGTETPATSDSLFERQVFDIVNQVRVDSGLTPLIWNDDLMRAARYHSVDMAEGNYFSHNTFDGSTAATCGESAQPTNHGGTQVCDRDQRIKNFYTGTNISTEETVWAGTGTYNNPDSIVLASGGFGWISSTNHRNIMLSPNLREAGVGYYSKSGSPCGSYATMALGNRDGADIKEKPAKSFRIYFDEEQRNLNVFSRETGGTVELFNILGKSIKSANIISGKNSISIPKVPAGIYIVAVKNDKEIFTQKIMVN